MTERLITCPTGVTMADGTRYAIVGCGSTNVEEDESEPGLYDCGDCGMWFQPALEPEPVNLTKEEL